MKTIAVVIADDHPLVRKAVKNTFRNNKQIEFLGEADNGIELLELIEKTAPDIAIVDLEMPQMNGYDTILKLHTLYPEIKIIAFSGFLNTANQQRAIEMGACASLCKTGTSKDFIKALDAVIKGKNYHADVSTSYYVAPPEDKKEGTLTLREKQILSLIAQEKPVNRSVRPTISHSGLWINTAQISGQNWGIRVWLKPFDMQSKEGISRQRENEPIVLNCLNPQKILIVDDEPAILKLLTNILTRQGHMVDTAEGGKEGIQKIQSNSYDIIITDIKMPGSSGIDVLNEAKRIKGRVLPVIATSGTPWLMDAKSFDAVLAKPFSRENLFEAIEAVVSSYR